LPRHGLRLQTLFGAKAFQGSSGWRSVTVTADCRKNATPQSPHLLLQLPPVPPLLLLQPRSQLGAALGLASSQLGSSLALGSLCGRDCGFAAAMRKGAPLRAC
jgi:hypothetical protein